MPMLFHVRRPVLALMSPRRIAAASLCLLVLVLLTAGLVARAAEPSKTRNDANPWTVLDRSITVDRDQWMFWQVDYRLRNDGPTEVVLTPAALSARVEGWVSNSKVAGHTAPRRSVVTASGTSGASGITGTTDLIVSSDEVKRCRERATLYVWPDDAGENPPSLRAEVKREKTDEPASNPQSADVRVAPGGTVRVRLCLDHEHYLYGPYNALLGRRSLELHLGAATIRDGLPLDQERRVLRAEPPWPASNPPAERLDSHIFLSAPDSLHLEAHIGGGQSFSFPDRPVRYSSRMRLKFWYLVAPGTEGLCVARLSQHRDLPNSWKVLRDGEIELPLTVVGRWVRVERIFLTEPEATTLTLEFRIAGHADIGELWLDDIALESVDDGPEQP